MDAFPCLDDATSQTAFDPHYFFQAAWLARKLAASRPGAHADFGSDVRAVAVLSAFIPVDFMVQGRPGGISLYPKIRTGADSGADPELYR